MSAQVVRFDAYRSVAAASITASYVAVGTPLQHVTRLIKFINDTDASVSISFDGATNNDIVPAHSFALYDFQTNTVSGFKFGMSINTQVYVKYTSGAPTTGTFYIVNIYGKGE